MRVHPKPIEAHSDEGNERAILASLVASRPSPLTIPELAREFGDRDAVLRAVCGLADFGLLEVRGSRGAWSRTVVRLAGALEVEVGDLLRGIEWVPPPPRKPGRFDVTDTGATL